MYVLVNQIIKYNHFGRMTHEQTSSTAQDKWLTLILSMSLTNWVFFVVAYECDTTLICVVKKVVCPRTMVEPIFYGPHLGQDIQYETASCNNCDGAQPSGFRKSTFTDISRQTAILWQNIWPNNRHYQ